MPNVFVCRDGTKFSLNGSPFPIGGVNCYFLAYCAKASRRAAMTTAKQMGANVIRTWAFADNAGPSTPPGSGVAFQYLENGVIKFDDGPDGLERLDDVIQTAEELGLKLILPLVNHWADFGGAPMYLKWLGLDGAVKLFYESLDARLAYRNWVRHVLTRRNSLTGRLYADEPSIMAWELTNEARCDGRRDILLDWVHEMAGLVKKLDGNHLLALGDEGFFNEHHFLHADKGQLYDGRHGTDFAAILDIPEIDFGGYHFYPQDWGYDKDLDFGNQWVTDHAKVGARAGKPVVMEEYGLKVGDITVPDPATRNRWFAQWLKTVNETRTAGSLLWMLGGATADTSGYKDNYVVHGPDEVPVLTQQAHEMGAA
jgi:mannan endo-1,4-beta-mannosidase